MIYSKTCEYAIRAVLYLAKQQEGKMILVREIAEAENIPQHFLSKIMQMLARYRIVISQKGKHGGLMLAKSASEINLYDVIEAIDGVDKFHNCLINMSESCPKSDPCSLHDSWSKLREQIIYFLKDQTLDKIENAK